MAASVWVPMLLGAALAGLGGGNLHLAHHVGQRHPLRRRAAQAARELDRRGLEAVLLARGAIQVEQRQPGLVMVGASALGVEHFAQAGFGALVVAVGEADGSLLELRVVGELLHVDGKELGRRKGGARRLADGLQRGQA
jgi:hypothetical protein